MNNPISASQYQLKPKHFKILSTISIIAILFMTWHDLDHLRVVMHRDYAIVPQQFVTVIVAHIPAIFALYMSYKRSVYAALVSLLAGIILFIGFILLHFIGTSAISSIFDIFLGEWKVPFIALHSDFWSWLNLFSNVVWSIVMIMSALIMLCAQIAGKIK